MGVKTLNLELYPIQHDFVASPDRFTAMISGIGAGKSYAGAVKSLLNIKPKTLGLVVSPTYPMLRDATLRTFLEICKDVVTNFHKGEMRAECIGGAEVLFRSADDPNRLRGANIHWAWIDEASLCPAETREIVMGRLRAGGRAGPMWITSTPKGRNWLYKASQEMTVFRANTDDNPYLSSEFVDSLKTTYTGAFARQELYGEFVTYEGLVYEEFDRSIHLWKGGEWPPFVQVIAGVDEGWTNPAVVLTIGVDNDGRVYVVEEFHKRRVLQADVVGAASDVYGRFGVSSFQVDPSAAGLIAEMQQAGLPAFSANNAVMDGIQIVKSRLVKQGDGKPRLWIHPSCVNLLAEMESYCWREGRLGQRDEPEKTNDHGPDALRYAMQVLNIAPASGVSTDYDRDAGRGRSVMR